MNEVVSIIAGDTENLAPMAEYAARYARNGWRIFPLKVGGKDPFIKDWPQVASCDPVQIAAWWTTYPQANIALLLDGLACLDVDPRHSGLESLAALEAEHGTLDLCGRQETGGNGWHFLFESGKGVTTSGDFRQGLDFLTGPAHYIAVEPSLHPSGRHYKWNDVVNPLGLHRNAIPLTVPPGWLLEATQGKKLKVVSRGKKGFTLPDEIGEGRRETVLASAAGKMRRASFSPAEIRTTLATMNQERCKPPLADKDVERIAKSIGRHQPAPDDEDAGLTKALATAITGAGSFARDKGGLLYQWEGGVYRPTGRRIVERRVKELCESWERTKAWSPELATRVEAWITVDAPELWECPPLDVLNCANGLLNVDTSTLTPHSPEHLSPVQIAANFDPQATCRHIDRFIQDVFPDDTRHLSAEVTAWLMFPDTSIQKAVLLLGEGANGKSAWLNLLLNFLGRENVSTLSLHRIEGDKFAAARMVGKLCNIGSDLPTAALASTSMFKALTGGDSITAERKYEASFEFRPFARLLFSANSAPRSDDATHGFFRRWLVIPFNRTFDET